ncbi:DUF3954 domain-containing protein [Virgibacillus sp. YIM 98842]|uniref:DUF3954 domain-containing protein n=1 Tax=Virgibacillus sp. YIM 98842 TaxID=2663533 RepID=UPI0013D93CCE|nr:DUF3954 domain-containing protein [Virgibacillus sp. YIM 98842]
MDKENFKEHTVYIFKDGKLDEVEPPETGFGKLHVNWSNGVITHFEASYTKK